MARWGASCRLTRAWCTWWPVEIRGQALRQLAAVWTLFVVVAGIRMVPPVLFGLIADAALVAARHLPADQGRVRAAVRHTA
eukprot:1160234-Prymnesium_polylepis.1